MPSFFQTEFETHGRASPCEKRVTNLGTTDGELQRLRVDVVLLAPILGHQRSQEFVREPVCRPSKKRDTPK